MSKITPLLMPATNMEMKAMKSFMFIIFYLVAVSVHAEIFKWVDENGTVHYGDKPTAGSQTIDVRQHKKSVKPSISSDSDEEELTREEKRQRVIDMLEEDRLAKNEARQKKKNEQAKKRRKCNSMKDYQKRAKNAGRMYQLDKDGNRVYMSQNQKSKSEQKLQKRIKKSCR